MLVLYTGWKEDNQNKRPVLRRNFWMSTTIPGSTFLKYLQLKSFIYSQTKPTIEPTLSTIEHLHGRGQLSKFCDILLSGSKVNSSSYLTYPTLVSSVLKKLLSLYVWMSKAPSDPTPDNGFRRRLSA